MKWFAARFGITNMKQPVRMPNTRRALTMAEYARDRGRLGVFRSLAMDARWLHDRDLEDESVLRELAAGSDLDSIEAVAALNNPDYQARVDQNRAEFKKLGVGGIPTFVLGNVTLEGCRPYKAVADAAVRAGAVRR